MFDTLTVREILSSTARLKLPERVGAQELEERVNKVVDALDISKCVDTQVGKCSGGEKRRLAVAAELLGEPSLIFLDEPTSGLDGASALNVMTILRRLAHEQNRTIICTIHQPRASLMPLADQLLLLADGRQVYAGPTWTDGRRDGMLGYLAALGFPSPSFENPADFVVDLVNSSAEEDRAVAAADKDAGSPAAGTDGKAAEHSAEAGRSDADEAEQAASLRAAVHAAKEAAQETADGLDVTGWQAESEAARLSALAPSDRIAEAAAIRAARSRAEFIEWLAEQFSASRLSEEGRTALTPDELPADPLAAAGDDGHRSRFPTGFCTQVGVVLRRVFLFKLREPEAVASLAASVLMMSVIVGMVYWQLPLTTSGLQDRLGFLSLFLISIAFSPLDLVLLIPRERSVFLRDTNANLYGTLAFYVGRTLADIPFHVGFSAVGAVIAYWMAGFQADAAKCGIFVLLTVILMFGTTSLFMAVGSLSPNVATANGIVSIVLLLAMLFSGIFVGEACCAPSRVCAPCEPVRASERSQLVPRSQPTCPIVVPAPRVSPSGPRSAREHPSRVPLDRRHLLPPLRRGGGRDLGADWPVRELHAAGGRPGMRDHGRAAAGAQQLQHGPGLHLARHGLDRAPGSHLPRHQPRRPPLPVHEADPWRALAGRVRVVGRQSWCCW